ncbi:MAG: citrate synthase [Deltaproteobacteria bacterium]|nr:citrate synthase [Deltaproteobacteria bacterium]
MTTELSPGLAGVPCAASKIADINGNEGKLYYRGYLIEDLAAHTTFEETSYLLLHGELPTKAQLAAFDAKLRSHRRLKYKIVDLLKTLPETGHPMDAIQAGVAAMGMFYPASDVMDKKVQEESVIRLIAKLPTLVAAFHRVRHGDEAIQPRDDLGHAANFLYMLTGAEPDAVSAKTLDVCLVLHAEHSMNASTFAARVVGSTMADPFTVVSSAIGALSGPLHGGANEEVLVMLDEIGSLAKTDAYIDGKVERKEKIMGLGHRVYKAKDPRATIMQHLAVELFETLGIDTRYEIAKRIETITFEKLAPKGIYPNVDFYSGILYSKLQIQPDLFTPIFAIARVSGWLAHWLEQLENNRIYRPDQVYVGYAPREFTPMGGRS